MVHNDTFCSEHFIAACSLYFVPEISRNLVVLYTFFIIHWQMALQHDAWNRNMRHCWIFYEPLVLWCCARTHTYSNMRLRANMTVSWSLLITVSHACFDRVSATNYIIYIYLLDLSTVFFSFMHVTAQHLTLCLPYQQDYVNEVALIHKVPLWPSGL